VDVGDILIGLYGHRKIDDKLLVDWLLGWDENKYATYVSSLYGIYDEDFKLGLKEDIQRIKEIVSKKREVEKGYYFDYILRFMNKDMINCYFRAGSSIVSVANFHEVLIEPADLNTRKKLIKGYELLDKGNIDIIMNNEHIGNIGTMSDLFWHAFYDEYIVEDTFGGIHHVRNNQEDLTLQIWKSSIRELDELEELVEKIIYDCSVKLGLNFKRASFDSYQKNTGVANKYSLELEHNVYERTPIQYFNFANYSPISRHQYLAYYQSIEYFFKRAYITKQMSNSKELEILKQILSDSIDEKEFIKWLSDNNYLNYYTSETKQYPSIVPLNLNEGLIDTISRRIYYIRCSLVHSKESPKEFNFIPNLNDTVLKNEVPLIRYIASKVIGYWSTFEDRTDKYQYTSK
jgi:hypothetical protein